MNVHELMNILKECPDDMKIVLSADPEGNSFGTLDEVDESFWDKDEIQVVHPSDVVNYEDGDLEKVLCFWP